MGNAGVATPTVPPTSTADVPLSVDTVSKTYGRIRAVADLSFRLVPGTVTGFLGPNGAGKTTTLRMIGGLLRPTAGTVRLFGIDARTPQARRRLGFMPADPVFLPHLSGHDNLDLLARLRRAEDLSERTRAAAALELTDHDLGRPVGGYSSGMRQKLAIVAALQHRPGLVVLDEPANRLDPIAHHSFCDLLRAAAAEGRTVLLSSHVLAEVEAVCDAVLLVREGRLLTTADVADLRRHARRSVVVTYAAPRKHPPGCLEQARVDGLVVSGVLPAERPDLVRALLDDADVRDVVVAPESLESIVLRLYTQENG